MKLEAAETVRSDARQSLTRSQAAKGMKMLMGREAILASDRPRVGVL